MNMFYQRDLLSKLLAEVDTDRIIVTTGMRQVGKTTLLKHVFDSIKSDNKVFLDLENQLHRKAFEETNYDAVWGNLAKYGISNKQKAYIFVDEIQHLPNFPSVCKYLYDHYTVKFFITGSSSYYLKNLFSESMAGRKLIYELFPLTFHEFLGFKEKNPPLHKTNFEYEIYKPYYQEYLEYGGFPKVVMESNMKAKKEILEEIFTSYFEKDVKTLGNFKDIRKLRELTILLTARVGSKLDISKLSSELGVTRDTVYAHLSFLEQTYFIPRYSKSVDKSWTGQKKLYFSDCGIVQILGNPSDGQILENAVFQSLRPFHNLTYFSNKKSGAEIDFILDKKQAIEVKNTASPRDIENLKRRTRAIDIDKFFIASLNYSDNPATILTIDIGPLKIQ